MSRVEFSMNISPLNTTVSRKVILFSDISAVNFIVGCNALACLMKRSNSWLYLTVPKGDVIYGAFSGSKLKTNFSTFSYLLSKMSLISCL